MQNRQIQPGRPRRFPDSLVLLFGLVVLAQLVTYVLPAGEFERIENEKTGRMQVKEGSFHYTPERPAVSPGAFLMASKWYR